MRMHLSHLGEISPQRRWDDLSLVSLWEGDVKTPENQWKSMTIANIDWEILQNFWTTWGISMKFYAFCLAVSNTSIANGSFFAYSSTDNFLSPTQVSDWLIFCCGKLILHQLKK